ncbi:PorT family protein [Flaviramulus sp. BrNp1-15]|uniref:porin family protein n=1 Tax=Flaviramulus sp. BrNp1-15 TaxID=2916754 RepID=UPI001EE79FE1|nr:porin family protein [Flaviramulus sp. BrNp1-15]ULC60863.1 PorT family protein [Flaviramulus sp. BrNp1-15]
MKKLILFIAVIAITGLTQTFSQDINFGAKAGVNFCDITGDDTDSFDGRTTFHIGLVAEIMITDVFAFQPEILYSAQGSDWEEAFEGETYQGTVKVDYLNIPLMAKYYVVEGFSVEAGPQIGFLLSANNEEEGFDDEDIKDDLKGIDFGINFGLGYKLDGGLNFGARYIIGLTDVNDNPENLGNSDYKNSVIQISVGYFF